jgi:hypothetical protein
MQTDLQELGFALTWNDAIHGRVVLHTPAPAFVSHIVMHVSPHLAPRPKIPSVPGRPQQACILYLARGFDNGYHWMIR